MSTSKEVDFLMLLLLHPDFHNELMREELYAEHLQLDGQTVNGHVLVLLVPISKQ